MKLVTTEFFENKKLKDLPLDVTYFLCDRINEDGIGECKNCQLILTRGEGGLVYLEVFINECFIEKFIVNLFTKQNLGLKFEFCMPQSKGSSHLGCSILFPEEDTISDKITEAKDIFNSIFEEIRN